MEIVRVKENCKTVHKPVSRYFSISDFEASSLMEGGTCKLSIMHKILLYLNFARPRFSQWRFFLLMQLRLSIN